MQKPITMRTRSIVDGLLVYCHGACEVESRHGTLFLFCFFIFLFDFILLLINLFIHRYKYVINNHFQTLSVAVYRYNDCKQCIPY